MKLLWRKNNVMSWKNVAGRRRERRVSVVCNCRQALYNGMFPQIFPEGRLEYWGLFCCLLCSCRSRSILIPRLTQPLSICHNAIIFVVLSTLFCHLHFLSSTHPIASGC